LPPSAATIVKNSLGKCDLATIPAGSRVEWGNLLPGVMNVGIGKLPSEGRVFLTPELA